VVLVDSTVWIDLLRNRRSHAVVLLERLLNLGEAAVTPVIVQEILQGARDARAFERLSRRVRALPTVRKRA
jgi:predicted nucleic acid-binding protein